MPSVPTKLLPPLLLIPSLTPYHSARSLVFFHFFLSLLDLQVTTPQSLDMSSVCGKLDFKDADFEISNSSPPTQSSNGSKHSSQAGSDESQESDGDETGYINQTENEGSVTKDLAKSTLGSLPPKSSDDEDKDENVTSTPVVLIPAIKGSREKHGLTLKKSSVSWADDVYDPPPSIASHTRNKKQQQQQQKSKSKDNHKKTGKKGQKNSSSRSGKDKKQSARKHSREKFDWGNSAAYCCSIFLNSSLAGLLPKHIHELTSLFCLINNQITFVCVSV
ncbi:Uncharacterized protein Rs2_49920 [Raphanus sativus]|nr:Uncharacterized protein Rs2_49920 [Raphanus sativus]